MFAVEDDLPPHAELQDLPPDFFSALTVDFSRPLLHPSTIRKLENLIGKTSRPTKRLRLASRDGNAVNGATPKGKGRMSQVDPSILSRTLKILERSVRIGEDLDPFRYSAAAKADPKSPSKSPSKSAAAKKASKGKKKGRGDSADEESHAGSADGMGMDEDGNAELEVEEADLENLTKVFEIAKESVMAADCCIALLASDRLAKQVRLIIFWATLSDSIPIALLRRTYHDVSQHGEKPADQGHLPLR